MNFYSVICFKNIADVGIDFGLSYRFYSSSNKEDVNDSKSSLLALS